MRTRFSLLFALLLVSVFFVLPIAAQESTPEATAEATAAPDTSTQADVVFCEPELIAQLYIADRYFGFGSVSTFDTTVIDKGDYAPLFDAWASMEGMNMSMLSDSQIAALTAATPVVDPSEVANCNSLGAALNDFYIRLAQLDLMPGAEATAEAGSALSADAVTTTGVFSGPAEVPGPGDADTGGTASVTLDATTGQVCYTLSVSAVDPISAAHIHRGELGVSGPVVVPLDPAPDATGNVDACVTADPAIVAEIIANPLGFYVNVHNALFPDGASRAQLGGA